MVALEIIGGKAMVLMKPVNSLPVTRNTEGDNALYWKACDDFQRFFPDNLCLGMLMKVADTEPMNPDNAELSAEISGKHGITARELNEAFAKEELTATRTAFMEWWITSLFKYCTDEPLEAKRLNDRLFPINGRYNDLPILEKYLLSGESASAVIEGFVKNVTAEIESSPNGLVVLPQDSHGMEVRIKKDENGYYLGDTQVN